MTKSQDHHQKLKTENKTTMEYYDKDHNVQDCISRVSGPKHALETPSLAWRDASFTRHVNSNPHGSINHTIIQAYYFSIDDFDYAY